MSPKSRSMQQVEVTIHSLKFQQKIDKAFVVSWVRGNSNGSTPQAFQNDDNEVYYDNSFKFKSTLFLHSDGSSKKSKDIKFKIYLMEDIKKRREIGSVSFDISSFKDLTQPTMGRYTCKTPYGPATLIVTIFLQAIEGKGTSGDGSTVTSDSNFSSSDMYNNETMFSSLPDALEKKNSLSGYSPKKPRSKITNEKIIIDPIMATSNVNSGGKGKIISRQSSFGQLKPLKLTVTGPVNKSSLQVMEKTVSTFQVFDVQGAIADINTIFDTIKERSPLNIESIPKVCAAIVAFFSDINAFNVLECEDCDFNNILSLIEKKLENESPIIGQTPFDKFYLSISLACVTKHVFFESPSRVKPVNKVFSSIACKAASSMTVEFKETLKPFVKSILTQSSKFESFLNKIERIISEIRYKTSEMEVPEFMYNFVIYELDKTLVTELLNNPSICTFGNAVFWNSFITSFASTNLGDLNLFRECCAVLMMSSTLCNMPDDFNNICPNLPKDVVVRLLVNQQPDEMFPLTNDTTAFCRYYNVDINLKPKDLMYEQFDAVSHAEPFVPISQWTHCQFSEDEMKNLPFLAKFFK